MHAERLALSGAIVGPPKISPRRRPPAFYIWWGWVLGCATIVVGGLVL